MVVDKDRHVGHVHELEGACMHTQAHTHDANTVFSFSHRYFCEVS